MRSARQRHPRKRGLTNQQGQRAYRIKANYTYDAKGTEEQYLYARNPKDARRRGRPLIKKMARRGNQHKNPRNVKVTKVERVY